MRAALAALLLLVACRSSNGTGLVEGEFAVTRCRPSGDRPVQPYAFEADRLSSDRYENTLKIIVGEYNVELEEADTLVVLLDDVETLRGLPRPTRLPVAIGAGLAHASLGLYDTCPSRPTLHARTGTLTLDKFAIAARPEDAGENEAIAGTLDVRVVSADLDEEVGWVRARFDFVPFRPLLRDLSSR